MSSIREQANDKEMAIPDDLPYRIVEEMGLGLTFRSCSCGQLPCARLLPLRKALEAVRRDERERAAKIAETDRFAPTDHGGLCLECGEWTPPRHPERGEHRESCSWSWVNGREFKGDARIAAAIRKGD